MKTAKITVLLTCLALLEPLTASAENIAYDPATWDYGNVEVGASVTMSFTIESTGPSSPLSVRDIAIFEDDTGAFNISSVTPNVSLPYSLAVGSTMEIVVSFTPVSQGMASASLVIVSNAGNYPYVYIPLQGTGVAGPIDVEIDIKPGGDPNSINLSSAGVIPVAILSSADFDATTVDPSTVSLAGASVKMVGKADKYLCHIEDVNDDSLDDLVCQVYTEQYLIEPGVTVAVLEAQTFDGQEIRGEDEVRIVSD